ncbi:hypothetical protein L2E82_49128 [Cichorium intybus]|uniref:Uncharacterized protein n=1 Tax=Cichorium intybus TaxID=13427 RepID=A0ACB8Z0W4_CICIN|nr:hypothetical protein L2E82_49128 [Cichorium intybus]
MEDGDDDFGDLYADVVVETSSAMNDAPQISQLQLVSDETGKRNSALEANSDKEDRVSDGDEDDDDDDLNIVLNSDDDSVRHGDGLTIPRTNTILRSGELDDEDDDNFGTEEFAGGKAVGNSHSSYKYSRSQSAAYGSELKVRGCGPQHGQRFSLPWSRSILDVNIDVFEQKPWKHPGADITDYFNFGLNEHSWKLYCNQVDEYRHRGPISSGSPASESAQLMERKGRAIQVEDSIVERQSSMDVRRQMDRDSDVIQITIVDSEDHCCGSTKEGSRNLENCVPESSKSNHGNDSGDNETDHLSFSSASDDESFEGNHENQFSVGKDEEIRTSDNTKERTGEDTCTTDLSILVAESSEAEKSPNKSFEDRWKSYSHERRSSTELTRSMNSQDLKRSDNHRYQSDKRTHGDYRYHSRYNSPVYDNITRKDSKPKHKFHHENDDVIFSRRQDEKRKPFEGRYHARRHGNPVNDHRMYERVHTFDPYNEERMLYSRESEPPLDYYHGERFERFGPEMGRPVFRSLEEEEYYEPRRYSDEFGWNDKRNGNNLHFGNKGVKDEFFLDREYCDNIKGENFRCFGYNEREKDEFQDEHLAFTRWEFRSPRRNKRRFSSPKMEEFDSHINNGRWHDNMMSRNSLYERKRSYEEQLSERFRYNDYEPFDRIEDYKMDYDDRVERSGDHHWQSEMKWKEDEIMMMPFEESIDDVYVKGRKCNFERSKNFEYEGSYEWVFKGGVDSFDTHKVDGLNANNQKKQVISGKKCRKSYGESGKKLSPSSLDSRVVFQEGKSCKKPQAVATKAIRERLDIEEGQILTEEVNTRVAHGNDGNGLQNQNKKTGVDRSRILEARAKMEKRRARFNEAVTCTKMDSDATTTKVSVQETGSNKPQRPARKRRWGGS